MLNGFYGFDKQSVKTIQWRVVIGFIDDILIYSTIENEDIDHLRIMLKILKEQ